MEIRDFRPEDRQEYLDMSVDFIREMRLCLT